MGIIDVYYDRSSYPIISANGMMYQLGQGNPQVGDTWPFYGPLLNGPFGQQVGTLNQVCIRTSTSFWLCNGIISGLIPGRSASLAFTGTFDNDGLCGDYVITGGSGDYVFRNGDIVDGNGSYPYERRSIRLN